VLRVAQHGVQGRELGGPPDQRDVGKRDD